MERPLTNIDESDYDDRDVLFGKGAHGNHHDGNKKWKKIVSNRVEEYQTASNNDEKKEICAEIVSQWRQGGGRFLDRKNNPGKWYDIGDGIAASKTAQRFRDQISQNKRAKKNKEEATKKIVRIGEGKKTNETKKSRPAKPMKRNHTLGTTDFGDISPVDKNFDFITPLKETDASVVTASTYAETPMSSLSSLPELTPRDNQRLEFSPMPLPLPKDSLPIGNCSLKLKKPCSIEKRSTSNQHNHNPKRPSLNRDNSATANRLKELNNLAVASKSDGCFPYYVDLEPTPIWYNENCNDDNSKDSDNDNHRQPWPAACSRPAPMTRKTTVDEVWEQTIADIYDPVNADVKEWSMSTSHSMATNPPRSSSPLHMHLHLQQPLSESRIEPLRCDGNNNNNINNNNNHNYNRPETARSASTRSLCLGDVVIKPTRPDTLRECDRQNTVLSELYKSLDELTLEDSMSGVQQCFGI